MKSFINSQGTELWYEDIGEGRPFVFLHGLGGTHEQLLRFHEPLAGVRYIIPDQEGHGLSQAGEDGFTFERMEADVLELLDHLRIGSAVLAGISMGAALCLKTAADHPERVEKLLLIRNAWVDQPIAAKIRRLYADLADALKANDKEAFLQSDSYAYIESLGSSYTRNAFLLPFTESWNVEHYQKYLDIPRQVPVKNKKQIEELPMRVTIAACQGDLCHPYEYGKEIHELIEGSLFHELPNKDEDPDRHNRLLNKIIREVLE